MIFSSNLQQIDENEAHFEGGRRVPFDVILALIGNVAPREALAHAGIQLAARPAEEPRHLTRVLQQRTLGLLPQAGQPVPENES